MNGIIAFCENNRCKAVFEAPNVIGVQGSTTLNFTNSKVGPCPKCGSMGLIPDGVYKNINEALTFIRGPKSSIVKLLELQELLIKFKNNPKPKDEVVKEVEKISPEYAQTIQKTEEVDFHKWIATIIAILTVAILVQQTYFKGNDDEIKDKVIEQLLKQNQTLIEQKKKQPTNVSIKIGRNEKCHCGSGIKYKKCCLNKK